MSGMILLSSDEKYPFNKHSLDLYELDRSDKLKDYIMDILRDEYDFPEEYDIIVNKYKCSDKEKHYWDQTSYDILKNGEKYISFNRNYHGTSCFAYFKLNEKEYLITSSMYMAICVINLTDKLIKHYGYGTYIKSSTSNISYFEGFCPVELIVYGDNFDTLKVNGCFWGAPYENIIFKIQNWDDLSTAIEIEREDENPEDEEDDE